MYEDGVYVKEDKPSMTLVNFGEVSQTRFELINNSLIKFLSSLELNTTPEIRIISKRNPFIKFKEDSEPAFSNEIDNISGNIVIGVTDHGIYDRAIDKYIFGFGRYRSGILSTYRFRNTINSPQKIRERLSKEIIKILALSTGVAHCSSSTCIITYHRSVTDLDTNTWVCDECRDNMKRVINDLLQG
jgi:predicted Zn-dependent protease